MRILPLVAALLLGFSLTACDTLPQFSPMTFSEAVPKEKEPENNIQFDPAIAEATHTEISELLSQGRTRQYMAANGKSCQWLQGTGISWVACRLTEKDSWHITPALTAGDNTFSSK